MRTRGSQVLCAETRHCSVPFRNLAFRRSHGSWRDSLPCRKPAGLRCSPERVVGGSGATRTRRGFATDFLRQTLNSTQLLHGSTEYARRRRAQISNLAYADGCDRMSIGRQLYNTYGRNASARALRLGSHAHQKQTSSVMPVQVLTGSQTTWARRTGAFGHSSLFCNGARSPAQPRSKSDMLYRNTGQSPQSLGYRDSVNPFAPTGQPRLRPQLASAKLARFAN